MPPEKATDPAPADTSSPPRAAISPASTSSSPLNVVAKNRCGVMGSSYAGDTPQIPAFRLRGGHTLSKTGMNADAGGSLPHHVPVVLDVVHQPIRLNVRETGFSQIFARLFLAPHRAEPFAALRQRHGHAVHGRDGVQERSDRVIEVLVHVARPPDVLHQVPPVGLQCAMDPL